MADQDQPESTQDLVQETRKDGELQITSHIEDLYKEWFLQYASYVILDRAVPCIDDGLKPVQRRILHAMHELEDGRYNKAANVIGHTMRYHPHGDMAISDALVKMGQKDLLIDTQGNWGNPVTGDPAAASRYIEARLSPFAKAVLFNDQTTEWVLSYDGRNKEPVALPAKFPLLLAQGAEGIAVGLSTRILPHNFCEIIKASISILKGRNRSIDPDFPSGGIADFSQYNDGARGGKVRVRAVISKIDSKTLRISELPFGITTTGLIDSILAANEKGKVKVKRVEDNTAAEVEIIVELPAGSSPDLTIEALYAFSDCEISISTNCCIIRDNRPLFCGVSEILHTSVEQTKRLLETELQLKRAQLREKLHFASLEQIFIEQKIYRKLEQCESWEDILKTIAKGLAPFAKDFIRDVTDEDLSRLTEIKIKRISKFDHKIAEEAMAKLKESLALVDYDLKNLTPYAIRFYEDILERFGKGRERKTQKAQFEEIKAVNVAATSNKLYVNRKEGFVGTGLKKEEYLVDCSDFDEVIGFTSSGQFRVIKVSDKTFIGKDLIHVDLFRRNDDRLAFNIIYRDGRSGGIYAKRFTTGGITRDKEYDVTRGTKGSKVLYFTANPNSEAEVVEVFLKPKTGKKVKKIQVDFGEHEIKSRSVKGSLITKDTVDKVKLLAQGASTLEAQKIWFDAKTGQLSTSEAGEFLGEFNGDERVLAIHKDGAIELIDFNIGHYFGTNVSQIEVFKDQVITAVTYEGERKDHYVKRFTVDDSMLNKRTDFIPQSEGSEVLLVTTKPSPLIKVTFQKVKNKVPTPELVKVSDFVDPKGIKALGKKLSKNKVKDVKLL